MFELVLGALAWNEPFVLSRVDLAPYFCNVQLNITEKIGFTPDQKRPANALPRS